MKKFENDKIADSWNHIVNNLIDRIDISVCSRTNDETADNVVFVCHWKEQNKKNRNI